MVVVEDSPVETANLGLAGISGGLGETGDPSERFYKVQLTELEKGEWQGVISWRPRVRTAGPWFTQESHSLILKIVGAG